MTVQTLDTHGLRCPQPTIKITVTAVRMKPGDVLEVVSDCPSFEKDVRDWCDRAMKTLLWFTDGMTKRCQIQF